MTKVPNPNQAPMTKRMLKYRIPFWDLGLGHWDLIGIWALGHWSFFRPVGICG